MSNDFKSIYFQIRGKHEVVSVDRYNDRFVNLRQIHRSIFTFAGASVVAEERFRRQIDSSSQEFVGQSSSKASGYQGQIVQKFGATQPGKAPAELRSPPVNLANVQQPYQQPLNREELQEKEPSTPDPLSVLLGDSRFSCSSKRDGYYADDSVNCRIFHYCVGGAKHSWMCPGGTVFHQVHLNCVPSNQDICSQSEKYHVVNDYLYKTLEEKGPNNTLRYYKRYYPENFLYGGQVPKPPISPEGSISQAEGYPDYDYGGAPAPGSQPQLQPAAEYAPPGGPPSYGLPPQAPPRPAPTPQKAQGVETYKSPSSPNQFQNYPETIADFSRIPDITGGSVAGTALQNRNSYGSPPGSITSQPYSAIKYDDY
ncbi:uncharacterized protein LOC143245470 [Tachypleus tridentatus]|uniref:uncharacterized protein LOC143245470 n=1 Tax=Tachypleus tridentatus TaxID=6853 RepID=UPI003FD10D44